MLTSLLLNTANDSTTIVQNINRTFDHVLNNIKGASSFFDGLFFTYTANQIAGICVLFYLGYEMWPVILGRRSPDVVKLFRPLLIAAAISCWSWIYLDFITIKNELAEQPKAMYLSARKGMIDAERKMNEKIEKTDSITKCLFHLATASKMQEDLQQKRSNGKGGKSSVTGGEGSNGGGEGGGVRGGGYENTETEEVVYVDEDHSSPAFWDTTFAVLVTGEYWLLRFVEWIIEVIASLMLQCYLCGIVIISELGTKILGMFGPIFFALSIADRFRDYWAKWIEKYIRLALYPFMAYLIMAFMTFIIIHQMEIQADMITLDKSENIQTFLAHIYQNFGVLINFVTALFIGSACMKAVPELASMVFPGAGPSGKVAVQAGQFMTGMTMTMAGAGVAAATNIAAKTVKTGAAASGVAAGVIIGGIGAAGRGPEKDSFGHKNPNKKGKNSLDSYAWYNPLKIFFGKNKPDTAPDGDSFEYKRGSGGKNSNKTSNSTGSYNPIKKYINRGQYINLGNRTSHSAKIRNIKNRTRSVADSTLSLASFILADHNSFNEQQWVGTVGNAIGKLKKNARSALSIAAVINYHYKKHAANGTYQAINRWQKERTSDFVFVRRAGIRAYYYQTYGEEAQNLARLTGEKVKYVKMGNQKIATFSISRHMLQPVTHRLNEMGLSVNVINSKGKSVYYKEDITLDKQDAIDRIKNILKKNGGGMKFNIPMNDFQTEMSALGKTGKKGMKDHSVCILGLMTDVYGAAFATVKDNNGKYQHIYLDRLLTKDINRLADEINTKWDNKENFFSTINPVSENELDNAFDEYNFTESESKDYSTAAKANKQQNAPEQKSSLEQDASNQGSDSTKAVGHRHRPQNLADPMQELKKEWALRNNFSLKPYRAVPELEKDIRTSFENNQKVIRRGRGIDFVGVDYRKRSGWQKTANLGWHFTKWTIGTTAKTGSYVLGVATGRRPLINLSAIGAWGFKTSYNSVRWMARQTTARNAVIAWKRENQHNYVIVNRSGLYANRFQSFGEEAVAIARILNKEHDLKVLKIGQGRSMGNGFLNRNNVPTLTLTKDDLVKLKAVLDKHGMTMDIINTRGQSLLTKNSLLTATLGIKQNSSDASPDKQASKHNVQQVANSETSGLHDNKPNKDHDTNMTLKDDDQGNEHPVVLDYSANDPFNEDKTFTLKDSKGKELYIVTGPSLRYCLEKMVKQKHSLKGLDLTNADLKDANLKGADLRSANLTEANLRGAKLQNADLSKADLTDANLRVANLTKANLTDAYLAYADLRDADLRKADITMTNFFASDQRGSIFGKNKDKSK